MTSNTNNINAAEPLSTTQEASSSLTQLDSNTTNQQKRKLSGDSNDLESKIMLTDPPPIELPSPKNNDDTQTQPAQDTAVQPPPAYPPEKIDMIQEEIKTIAVFPTTKEPTESELVAETTYQLKKKICLTKLRQLNTIRLQSLNNLSEQYYLEQNYNYLSYTKFLNSLNGSSLKLTNDLKDYIKNKFPLDQKHDLNNLETKLANKFSMHVLQATQPIEPAQQPQSSTTKNNQIVSLSLDNKQQQSIAERAKHEAQIIQRITQLRKEGLWSIKRLPKLVEPQRAKSHWDFLLDEMTWMATDFQQERKWKKNSCKKLSIAIQKYFKEKEFKAEMAEREETKRLRKQAGLIARDIMQFWRNVEKIIEYKQRSLIEEKRKQALDLHLNFIVDQTEKYSSWLIESLANQQSTSRISEESEVVTETRELDNEYEQGEESEADDESTIEKEEKLEEEEKDETNDELKQLQMESEIPIEDLLKDYNLDDNYFMSYTDSSPPEIQPVKSESMDIDEANDDDSSTIYCTDDEELNNDEEKNEEKISDDNKPNDDLTLLKTDNLLSIDELLSKSSSPDIKPLEQQISNDSIKEEDPSSSNKEVLSTIAATAQSLQPTGYTLETTTVKTKIPSQLLKHTLREYQHVGLDWLVTINENKLNGILADEMGLGKTIQTIALLAHLACEKGTWGPHLIVVPTSVMLNWELEFKKWCPGFKILTYYGSPKERKLKRQGWTKVNAFHVCITSYKLVIQDHAAFRRKKWKYFILDEAQNIKNFKSQRWQCLLNFQSQRRLLLTGTPLQNNLMELWSLMHFLMPHVFSSHREFQHWFSNPLKCMIEGNQEYNEQLIRRLHKVLRPFILRRLKIDVEKQMPKKYEHIVMCKLSKRQRLLYDEFMSLSSTKKKLAEGHYMSVINILMQLRKVCNHPDLFEPRQIVSSFVTEPIHYHVPSLVFNLSEELHTERVSTLFFYQPSVPDMELLYSVFECHRSKQLQTPRKYIEDVMMSAHQKQFEQEQELKFDPTNQFFPSSNLEGLAINEKNNNLSQQIRFDLNKQMPFLKNTQLSSERLRDKIKYLIRTNKWHCSMKPTFGQDLHECIGRGQIINTSCYRNSLTSLQYNSKSFATCQESFLFENETNKCISTNGFWSNTNTLLSLLNFIRESLHNPKLNHVLYDILTRFVVYIPHVVYAAKMSLYDPFDACSTSAGSIRLHVQHPEPSLYQKQRVLIEDITNKVAKVPNNYLTSKIESLMSTQFPEKRLIQYDCGKLQTLADLLRNLYADTHRVLLFTQMTRMLDILENFLNYHGYKYLRLDGSTSIEQRQVLMERFNNDKRIFCFILSTRSGGIGVNLTGADTVIFYDSDWNPTMDAQAQDRCHRIGQTRDVHIYRLISNKTVEENILKKANQKRLLSEMTIEGGCFTTALLKKHHISELFNDDPLSPVELITNRETIVVDSTLKSVTETVEPIPVSEEPILTESHFEDAIALVEDESDVLAAKELKAEVHADIAEFDENNIELIDNDNGEDTNDDPGRKQAFEMNKVENAFKSIETELKPIERYALKFLESYGNIVLIDEEKEIEIEKVKKDWELNRLKQLKEDEERKAEQEEDDMMYTYTKTEVSTLANTKTLNKLKLKTKQKLKKNKKNFNINNNISNINTRRKTTLLLNTNNNIVNNGVSPSKKLLNSPTKKLLKLKNNNKKRLMSNKNRRQLTTANHSANSLIDNELVKFKKLNEKRQNNDIELPTNKQDNKEERLLSQKQFESSIMKSIKRAAAKSSKAAADLAAQVENEFVVEKTFSISNESNTIKINKETISPKCVKAAAVTKPVTINSKLKEKKAKKIKNGPILNATNSKFIRHLINSDTNSNSSTSNEQENNKIIVKKPRISRRPKKDKLVTNQVTTQSLDQKNLHTLLLNRSTASFLSHINLTQTPASNPVNDLSLNQLSRSKSPTISTLIANAQQQPKVTYFSNNNQSGTIRTIVRPTQVTPQLTNTTINLATTTNTIKTNSNSMLSTLKTITCTQKPPPTLTLTQANISNFTNKPILITKPLNQQTSQTKVIIKTPAPGSLTSATSTINKNQNFWILNRPTQVTPITATSKPPLTVVMSPSKAIQQQQPLNNRITIINNKESLLKTVNLFKNANIPLTSNAANMDLTSSANIVNNVLAQTKSINNLMSANSLDSKLN